MDVEVLNAFLAIHSPVHSTAYLTTPVLYRIWPRGVDFDPEASDADFLVEFDPDSDLPPLEQFFGLVDALREALGRPVDVVEYHEFRNPYLRASINESREVVYAS